MMKDEYDKCDEAEIKSWECTVNAGQYLLIDA